MPVPGRLRRRRRLRATSRSATAARRPPRRCDGVDLRIAPGRDGRPGGRDRRRQVDAGQAGRPLLRPDRAARCCVDGKDLRDLDLAAYRHRLGVVPQEPFLFTGTVRDNIAYGRPDATDAEVEAAARAVGAHELVAALPGGYHHPVGERGRSLSAGQRQLVALARAELVDPAILLLDEATAQLDLATEAMRGAAMAAVAAGRTTLVIAHRLPTARRRPDRRDRRRPGGRERHPRRARRGGGRYAAAWSAFRDTSVTGRAPATTLRPSGSGSGSGPDPDDGPTDGSADGKGDPPAPPSDPAHRLASR